MKDPDDSFFAGETDELAEFVVPNFTLHDEPGQMPFSDGDAAAARLYRLARRTPPFAWSDDPRMPVWKALLAELATGSAADPVEADTEDLWQCLYAVHRAERFSDGVVEHHALALTRIANEIRRRLLAERAAGKEHHGG